MSLVWQCARCLATDPGSESQREGRNPPSTWLQIRVPESVALTAHSRPGVICDICKGDLYEWLHSARTALGDAT